MENKDKGLNVPKWVLINLPRLPQNSSAQIVCSSPKVWDFPEKRLLWASVVRDLNYDYISLLHIHPNIYPCARLHKFSI